MRSLDKFAKKSLLDIGIEIEWPGFSWPSPNWLFDFDSDPDFDFDLYSYEYEQDTADCREIGPTGHGQTG